MGRTKTKVADRKKAQRHEGRRQGRRADGSGGASGGGGLVSGMRAGVQSLVGRGRKRGEDGSPLFTWVMWALFAAVIVFLIARRGC